VQADERPDHYKGEPAPSLEQALENALHRISEEVDGMAVKLESIHVASEERDSGTIRDQAPGYIAAA